LAEREAERRAKLHKLAEWWTATQKGRRRHEEADERAYLEESRRREGDDA
jgi:hypothetical protein